MRRAMTVLLLLFFSMTSALAQISVGINLTFFPELVLVPGYPVYYAPRLDSNYFFYDGRYWLYQDGNWLTSGWYDGPWELVGPEFVPVVILRVPLRYYRAPPVYFYGWPHDAPPRWGELWGHDWQQHRSDWARQHPRVVPAPAPLPLYQRQFPAHRYPHVIQQRELAHQHYRYQPRDPVVRQQYQIQVVPSPTHRPARPQDGRPRGPGQEREHDRDQERGPVRNR
jgi:hypothetical protein